MEFVFYVLIILLLGANLYFSLKKDDEKDNDDEYLIKGIVSEIIENEESQIYKLLDKSDQTVKEFLEKTGEIKSSISGVDQQTRNLISVLNNNSKYFENGNVVDGHNEVIIYDFKKNQYNSYLSKGLINNIKEGSKVKTKTIANNIASPVKTPK